MRGRVLRRLLCLGVLVLGAASAPAAHATLGLTTGFSTEPLLTSGDPATSAIWLPRAVAAGAGMVRVDIGWSGVAPLTRPSGFNPADPATPGYNWASTDAAIRYLNAYGLNVLINITGAPAWAEGPHRPPGAPAGAWRPSPAQFASFATAAALRYDGHFPDPLNPAASLPRVRFWEGWNEPNLDKYLAPQWTRSRGRYVPASPSIFRGLTNAFYAAVKRVDPSNLVVLGGTAPFGDPPGGQRMPPVAFDRFLFCLQGAVRLTPIRCPDPVHFDALDHHPFSIGAPLQPAFNADDASVADMHKIARVLKAAERAHQVLPAGAKQLWVTEVSWDSSPPDPHGVPIQTQARWYEQGMYVLWSQGVNTVLFLQLVDSPPIPNYASTYQSGLYFVDGRPKPTLVAFRFPFVTVRRSRRLIQAWGRAPQAGTLAIEDRQAGHWKIVRRLALRAHQVFLTTLRSRGRAALRAQLSNQTSLTWNQGA